MAALKAGHYYRYVLLTVSKKSEAQNDHGVDGKAAFKSFEMELKCPPLIAGQNFPADL